MNSNGIRYSKKVITKTISDDNKIRKYQANKLGAMEVSLEGFKLLKALTPSIGVGIDEARNNELSILDSTQTVSWMLQLLSDNLKESHYMELVDKLLGSLVFNGEAIEDWSDHFDDYEEDFLEVLIWLFKDTFYGFFMKSTILKPLVQVMEEMKEVVLPRITEVMTNVLKHNEQDSNEES